MGCVALVSDGRDRIVKLRANFRQKSSSEVFMIFAAVPQGVPQKMNGEKAVFIAASNLIWCERSLRVSRVADRKPEKKNT